MLPSSGTGSDSSSSSSLSEVGRAPANFIICSCLRIRDLNTFFCRSDMIARQVKMAGEMVRFWRFV